MYCVLFMQMWEIHSAAGAQNIRRAWWEEQVSSISQESKTVVCCLPLNDCRALVKLFNFSLPPCIFYKMRNVD